MYNMYDNHYQDYEMKIKKVEEQKKMLNDYEDTRTVETKEVKKQNIFKKLFSKKNNNEIER